MISRKLGPTPDTEYVDERSVALPSIIQIGDVEFQFSTNLRQLSPKELTLTTLCLQRPMTTIILCCLRLNTTPAQRLTSFAS